MNTHLQRLQEHLKGVPIEYGNSDAESLSDMLYESYASSNPIDNQKIRLQFNEIDEILSQLTLSENNQVFEITSELCEEHTHLAFLAGVHVGFLLNTELTPSM